MKMIISMLLLCLTSFPMSDKSEKLEAQLGSIQQQLLKWNVELNDFQKWDLDNNGILDDTEKAALNSRKAEIAKILKRLEHIAKLKGLNLPLVALDVKDSNTVIPKKGFAETVEEIIKSYLGIVNQFYLKEQKDLRIMLNTEWDVQLNSIFTHEDQIIADLKADFLKVLNKTGAKTMGELADLLLEMLGTYNKDYIEKYYGKEYKGKAITPEIIKGMFPDAAKLKKAIESGIDKTDPNHPDAKAADKAEKEKLESEFKKFKTIFAEGISNEMDKIEYISTNGDTSFLDFRIIDETKLLANKDEIEVASYAKGFKDNIVNSVYNFAKNNKLTRVIEIKRVAKALLAENSSDEALKSLFIEYKKSKNYNTPTGFASWINQSAITIDLKSFIKHYKENWADKVIGAVDSFQRDCKSKGLNFKADRFLIDNNLKRILGAGVGKNNKQLGLDIHQKFMFFLPAYQVIDYSSINYAWKQVLLQTVKTNSMKELYSSYFAKDANNFDDVIEAIESIDTILPNIDAIVNELYNSRYYEKPVPKPSSKEPLLVKASIGKNGRKKHRIDLALEVPLRFEIRKGKNNEMLYHPVPSQDLSDISIINSCGFSFSELKSVYVGKTQVVNKSGLLETVSDYCWKLSLKDSAEHAVIEEPKLGETISISASMGDLEPVKELGLDPQGFQVKIVDYELNNVGQITKRLIIMGLPFVVGNSKDGPVGYFENPLAYKDAVLQYKYGNKNMDLYISCQVRTFIGADYSINVETSNVKLGMQNGAFAPDELILSNSISNKIVIERPGKVE